MSASIRRVLSNICFVSVLASIAIWFLSKEADYGSGLHLPQP